MYSEIKTGSARSEFIFILPIPMIPSNYPLQFNKIQYPVNVCFAMIINELQGQLLKTAGIDLRKNYFSHIQFYIACSSQYTHKLSYFGTNWKYIKCSI
jgi:hypothetical protein